MKMPSKSTVLRARDDMDLLYLFAIILATEEAKFGLEFGVRAESLDRLYHRVARRHKSVRFDDDIAAFPHRLAHWRRIAERGM